LVAALVMSAAIAIAWLRQREMAQTERSLSEISLVLREHAAQSFRSADLFLISTVDRIAAAGGDAPAERAALHSWLKDRIAVSPQMRAFLVLDAAGESVVDSASLHPRTFNGADRDYFAVHRDNANAGPFIGTPIRSRITDLWTIPVSRRISAPDGAFAGIAVVAVDPQYFVDFYAAASIGRTTAISIFRRDGVLLTRHPFSESSIGRSFAAYEPFRAGLAAAEHVGLRRPSPIDGEMRVISARSVRDFPLVVNASQTIDEALQSWRYQALIIGIGTAGSTSLLLVFGLFLVRIARRHELLTREIEIAKDQAVASQRAAERADRAKTEFLASMSHELRTPLNAIIGFADALRGGTFGALTEKQKEYIGDIRDAGNHLLTLIGDVLDMAKIEATKLTLDERTVDLANVVEAAARYVRPRIILSELELALDVQPRLPLVRCDEVRMRQILLNLLSNAVKFAKAPGRVVCRVAADSCAGVTIAIEDTGIGMSPSEIEVALQPFGQIDKGLTRPREGSGLGLPIAKAMVELHGGGLEIRSAPGIGTTVVVRLPKDRIVESADAGG
jgi:signal transduction histidine kinase